MDSNTSRRRQPACPCCIFLQEDLFLPPGPTTSVEEEEDSPCETGEVLSPQEALKSIQQYAQEQPKPPILLVDTHNHSHLNRERHEAYHTSQEAEPQIPLSVVSLTLAVEPADWTDAIQYSAAGTDLTLMGFGVHPWYLSPDILSTRNVWKQKLEELLELHPSAIVGEIGLCKMAKCARTYPENKTRGFELQREVLQEQLQIAVRYNRPVSVHCVQQHGVFLEILNEILTQLRQDQPGTSPFRYVPPAIAMHSFTGTAHHVKQLLQWEAALFGEGPNDKKKKKGETRESNDDTEKESKSRPPLIYFGFSHIVNYEMCTSDKARKQGRDAVRAVPFDRLLAESDVHHPEDVAAGTAGAIAYMAWALGQPVSKIASVTAKNGLHFLQSHLSPARIEYQ